MSADEAQVVSAAMDPELGMLLERLPEHIRQLIERAPDCNDLLEVVLDLGRLPEARFAERSLYLSSVEVEQADLEHVMARIGPFGDDNRAGLERTLHRISALRNRSGKVIGLTCRVGRTVAGTAQVITDLIMSGRSILLVGRPGVGKTTMLREAARVLADEVRKRVVIVDTSNEIAGDGDVPHPAIGHARRLQVPTPAKQHAVMIEAVENHMPEAIIIDEMGTEAEALAARTIAERGVQLIATAHGNTLENLLANPTLSDLVGGIHAVTLSDEEARRRRTQKTVLERRAPPTFDVLVEIQDWNRVAVHADVTGTVDRILRGAHAAPETRWVEEDGHVERRWETAPAQRQGQDGYAPAVGRHQGQDGYAPAVRRRQGQDDYAPVVGRWQGQEDHAPAASRRQARNVRVFPFGVSVECLAEASRASGLKALVVERPDEADVVLTTKAHYRRRAGPIQAAEEMSKPVYVLRRNTADQVRHFLDRLAGDSAPSPAEGALESARDEAQAGVGRIVEGEEEAVELQPQSAVVRRMQHRIAEEAQLRSFSTGYEPRRRVTIRRG